MRVLYDSNIFISYLLNPGGSAIAHLFDRKALKKITLLLPQPLVGEFTTRIKTKSDLSERISSAQLKNFIKALSQMGEVIQTINQPIPKITRDPKDDYLIAYAVVGKADYLVTGDKDLLVLKRVGDLAIVNPRDFTSLLEK